jgi:hypothetical protein
MTHAASARTAAVALERLDVMEALLPPVYDIPASQASISQEFFSAQAGL